MLKIWFCIKNNKTIRIFLILFQIEDLAVKTASVQNRKLYLNTKKTNASRYIFVCSGTLFVQPCENRRWHSTVNFKKLTGPVSIFAKKCPRIYKYISTTANVLTASERCCKRSTDSSSMSVTQRAAVHHQITDIGSHMRVTNTALVDWCSLDWHRFHHQVFNYWSNPEFLIYHQYSL